MAYTTINKSSAHFNTKLYTGTGSTASITGVGFQPDWTWIKVRNNTDNHVVFDAVRSATKRLEPNDTAAEATISNELTAFNSDGFSIGGADRVNRNNDTYASWNWKANGQGSSNTAGSINTTYTSVNTTAGFSIVSWTGNGANATVGHGLGSIPKMIITKSRTNGADWWGTYHHSLGNNKALFLNDAAASGTRTYWNNTTPTTSVFSVSGERSVNGSSENLIAYCFAEKQGYSKFGSYVGNGNVNGPMIYTGFKPAFVVIKGAISGNGDAAQSWELYDNKRLGYNVDNNYLQPNTSSAENTADRLDIVSNGFKIRVNSDGVNDTNSTYIYMAFAEAPLVGTNNVPCTAR